MPKKKKKGDRKPGNRSGVYGLSYATSAYGWWGGPYWGPGGSGQVGALNPDQFGSGGGDPGSDPGSGASADAGGGAT